MARLKLTQVKFCAQDKDFKKATCSESLLGYISLGKKMVPYRKKITAPTLLKVT